MRKCQTVTVTNWNINYSCSSQLFNKLRSESSCLRWATAKACPTAPCINLEQTKPQNTSIKLVLLVTINRTLNNHFHSNYNYIFIKTYILLSSLKYISHNLHLFPPATHWIQSASAGRLFQETKPLKVNFSILDPHFTNTLSLNHTEVRFS